jgi:uncharacterized membrane protein
MTAGPQAQICTPEAVLSAFVLSLLMLVIVQFQLILEFKQSSVFFMILHPALVFMYIS